MVGEQAHRLGVAARRKELERADADMARRHPGQDRARQRRLAQHDFAGRHGRQRTGGGNPERRHGLAHDVFAQHGTERRTAVAAAGEGRRPGTLELDVAPDAVAIDHLAQQDGASIAELRHEMAELVPRIGERDRLRGIRDALARQDLDALGAREPVGVEAEVQRKRAVELHQLRRRDRRR